MLRRIGALNFIEQFKYGALTLALPLYLMSRGVEVRDVGLVLSLLPLAFVLIRLVASVFADVMGVKIFFIFSMALQALTSLIYSYAVLPIHFAIGKLAEGADEACFWAVDRTAIIARSHEKKSLAFMGTVREFGGAIGILGAGLMITYFSFDLLSHSTFSPKPLLALPDNSPDWLLSLLRRGYCVDEIHVCLLEILMKEVFS